MSGPNYAGERGVPGTPGRLIDEAYSEAMDEIVRLKALLVRAADALTKWNVRNRFSDLIDELRKAAK